MKINLFPVQSVDKSSVNYFDHISISPFAEKYCLPHSATSLLLYLFDPVRDILIGPIFTILGKKLIKTDKLYRKLPCNIRKEVLDVQYFHSRRVSFVTALTE